MQFFKYIFCILVYRNTEDLTECLVSIGHKVSDCKIIIVNAFYDDQSKVEFEKIARDNNCDFISIPNKGYSFGNNRGIEFAINHYEFDCLIVANPDIIIEKFDTSGIDFASPQVIAPIIKTIGKKNQNPYWLIKNRLGERLIYLGMKNRNRLMLFFAYGINKVIREIGLNIFLRTRKHKMKVYAAHGSFCMFTHSCLKKLGLPYDENMFLFAEEALLADILKTKKIDVYLTKDILITHKEDGSMNIANIDEMHEERKSIIYYYEKINQKGRRF